MIRSGIETDEPHPMGMFLGCSHEEATKTSPWTGKPVRVMEYKMESYLEAAVAKYKQLAGVSALRKVTTPFIEDVDPDLVVNNHAAGKGGASAGGDALDTQPTSELKNCAASVLMQLLYCARLCRYDLLHGIGRLACLVTKWDSHCDKMLHRMMCYVESTLYL